MVTASYLPVAALLLARLLGASSLGTAEVALAVTIVLLVVYGHAAGRAAGLRGLRLAAVTSTAGELGVAMVGRRVVGTPLLAAVNAGPFGWPCGQR